MAFFPIHVETFHSQHPELLARELRQCTRAGHYAMGVRWLDELLEEHFVEGAKAIFDHAPRTMKYLRQKRALARIGRVLLGGTVDNVASGTSLRAILRSKAARLVKAAHDKTTIDMIVPWYFKLRRRTGKGPDKVRETLAVSGRHARLLAAAATAGFLRRQRQVQARKTTKTT